jgi:hypothetical protein
LNRSSSPAASLSRLACRVELLANCLVCHPCPVCLRAAHSSRPQGAHRGTRLWRVCPVIQNVRALRCAVLGEHWAAGSWQLFELMEQAAAVAIHLRPYHSLLLPAPTLGRRCPRYCLTGLLWCTPLPPSCCHGQVQADPGLDTWRLPGSPARGQAEGPAVRLPVHLCRTGTRPSSSRCGSIGSTCLRA